MVSEEKPSSEEWFCLLVASDPRGCLWKALKYSAFSWLYSRKVGEPQENKTEENCWLAGSYSKAEWIMECAEDPGWAKQKPNENSKPNAFFEKCDLMVIYCVLETSLHVKSLHQDWSLYYSWTAKVQRGLVTCLGYTAGEWWAKIQTQWDWVQHSCISGRGLEKEGWRGCLYWAFGRFRKSQRCIIQENEGLVLILWTWERLVLMRGIVLGI